MLGSSAFCFIPPSSLTDKLKPFKRNVTVVTPPLDHTNEAEFKRMYFSMAEMCKNNEATGFEGIAELIIKHN
jgi:hypothetical protein